jgi:flagellar hook-length control protein FliK
MQIPSLPIENMTERTPAVDNPAQPVTPAPVQGFPLVLNAAAPLLETNAKPKSELPPVATAPTSTDESQQPDVTAVPLINPLAINLMLTQLELLNNMAAGNSTTAGVTTQPPVAQQLPAQVTTQVPTKAVPAKPLANTVLTGMIPDAAMQTTTDPVQLKETLLPVNDLLSKDSKDNSSFTQATAENVKPHMAALLPAMPDITASGAAAPIATIPLPPPGQNTQVDKGVNALLQLGQMINSHTAAMANPQVNTSQLAETDYVKTAKRVANAEFETRIELQQPTLDSMLKNTLNANIKIYPPELGHVLAKLKMDKNTTELFIMTENNAVKEIVEANLPQLRQSFLQADINLTNIEVQSSVAQEKNPDQHANHQTNQALNPSNILDTAAEPTTTETPAKIINSLVDTYA